MSEVTLHEVLFLNTTHPENIAVGFNIQILSHLKLLNYMLCCNTIIYMFSTN